MPALLRRLAIQPALSLLPERMTSPEAEALLLAIAYQESDLEHRAQVPSRIARSYWQAERGGGMVYGVLHHPMTSDIATSLCRRLDVEPDTTIVYRAIEWHDVLAAGLARLLLWTLPQPLPLRDDEDEAYSQYLAAWRPGAERRDPHGTRRRWSSSYARAWEVMA